MPCFNGVLSRNEENLTKCLVIPDHGVQHFFNGGDTFALGAIWEQTEQIQI